MSEQKPGNKLTTAAKLIGVCVVCIGAVYGIVTLISALAS
jgi:hypothetical protein